MSSCGRRLLSAIIYSQDANNMQFAINCTGKFRDGEVELYDFVLGFYSNYGDLPSVTTITENLGDVLVDATDSCKFYEDEVGKRYLQNTMKAGLLELQQDLIKKDPQSALKKMQELASNLTIESSSGAIIDYRKIGGKMVDEYMKMKLSDDSGTLMFGWPTLDEMTGGGRAGDFISLVGRPSLGKTMSLLCIARKHWLNGGTPMVVSMEMPTIQLAQRLITIDASIPLTRLYKAELTKAGYSKLVMQLEKNKTAEKPFWMLEGEMSANVDELISHARYLKPTAIFVDGAYLLGHPNFRLSRWDRITENAELLKKKVAGGLQVPVVATYQFKRGDTKNKKKTGKEELTRDDVYGSDAIAQLSSIMLGLLEDDTVETEQSRKVSVLKGRQGEAGSFRVKWDFNNMNFDEILPPKDDEPQESEEMGYTE